MSLSRPALVLTGAAAGAVLGPGDLLAQRALPYPWANLANSSAVWALAAFAIGAWTAHRRARPGAWPAAVAVVLLLVAVETYYGAAAVLLDDSTSQLWSGTTASWLLLAVVAGAVLGTAGGWSVDRAGLRAALGAALPAAVLLAEAGLLATRPDHGDTAFRTDNLQTAGIEVALAALVLLVAAHDARRRLRALAVSLPLAGTALAAFRLVGFGQ